MSRPETVLVEVPVKEIVGAVIEQLVEGGTLVEVVRCKDCKHNPNETWFECPLAMFNENQRPETAWCWKAERRDDGL